MKLEEWVVILGLCVFMVSCVVFLPPVISVWQQPKLSSDSPGSQLVVATDAVQGVTCYRFAYHDGIQCFKNNGGN